MSQATLTGAAVLAVDGGNSKTDLALVGHEGTLIATSRAPGSSHQRVGLRGAVDAIHAGLVELSHRAGLAGVAPLAEIGVYCLAGVDLPIDLELLKGALRQERVTNDLLLYNDTLAVLWAGSTEGWGVAVAAGTGLNCVGIDPGGRQLRFPALGQISGDWVAGGRWLGTRALGQAVRASDGRGPRTSLEEAVPAYYDLPDPMAVAEAVYTGKIEERQLHRLAPTVFEHAAKGDEVARSLLDQMADEVVTYVRATVDNLRLRDADVPIVLGGGLFRSGEAGFLNRVYDGIARVAPRARVRLLEAPPVLGAAMRGLREIGAEPEAGRRVTRQLSYVADAGDVLKSQPVIR